MCDHFKTINLGWNHFCTKSKQDSKSPSLWLLSCPPTANGISIWLSFSRFLFIMFFFFLPYVNIFIDALSAFVIEHSLEGIMMNPDTSPLELTDSRELGRKRNPKRECLQSTILNSYSQGFYGYFLKGDFQRFMLPPSPCLWHWHMLGIPQSHRNSDKQLEKSMHLKACLLGLTKPRSLLSLGLYQAMLCCLEFKIPKSVYTTQTLFGLAHLLHFWAFQSFLAWRSQVLLDLYPLHHSNVTVTLKSHFL